MSSIAEAGAVAGPVPSADARVRSRAASYGGVAAAVLALGHLANDLATGSFSVLLPTLQQRFSLSEAWVAALAATFSFGVAFPQPFMGALADRMDRRNVTIAGMVMTAVLVSLIGVAPTPWALVALLTVAGLGSAALHPAASSLAGALGGGRAGVAVGLFTASGMIGGALGPVVVLALVSGYGLERTPWLMLPGLLLALVLLAGIPPQPPAPSPAASRLPSRSLFTGAVGAMALSAAFGHLPVMAISNSLPLWMVTAWRIPADSPVLGVTLATFSLAAAVGAVGAGAVERWLPRHLLVPASLLLAPVPMYAMLNARPGSALFFASVALAGLLAYASIPLLVVAAQESAPAQRSAASGMITGLGVGLAALAYLGVGHLQEQVGIEAALRWVFPATLPAAALSWGALRGVQPSAAAHRADGACDCSTCACRRSCVPACAAAWA